MKTITLRIDDTVYSLLEVLTRRYGSGVDAVDVEDLIYRLIDHAQQGVYRPGGWERGWLCQAFGAAWVERLEPGDPYGRSDSPMSQRPKKPQ